MNKQELEEAKAHAGFLLTEYLATERAVLAAAVGVGEALADAKAQAAWAARVLKAVMPETKAYALLKAQEARISAMRKP